MATYMDGKLHHIAVVYENGKALQGYLDGALDQSVCKLVGFHWWTHVRIFIRSFFHKLTVEWWR